MELIIKIPLGENVIEESLKEKQTVLNYALRNFNDHAKGQLTPVIGPLKACIMENEEPFIQINVDLHGIMRVLGGVYYYNKNNEKIELLVVDEGASFLLFRIKEKEALFYGGLNGTELKRFQSTELGNCFSYYKRRYFKMSISEVAGKVDSNFIYYYAIPDEVEDPRKKAFCSVL